MAGDHNQRAGAGLRHVWQARPGGAGPRRYRPGCHLAKPVSGDRRSSSARSPPAATGPALAGGCLHQRRSARQGLGRHEPGREEVAAADPDDSLLKLAIAYAEGQRDNLRKAAAILDSINPSSLAGPDQISQLADMEIRLEKLAGADKAVSRLREVAPDNEQLIFLQGQALTYRAKFSEAMSTLAKLRDRSRLDTPLSIPSECMALSRSDNQAPLRDFIEHWREPE